MWLTLGAVGALLGAGAYYMAENAAPQPRARVARKRTAAIIGATGATGKRVMEELLARDSWTKIIVIGRRGYEGDTTGKVVNVIVKGLDDPDVEFDGSALKGVTHFFNCIGTTRGAAGGGDAFYNVEVEATRKVAHAARAANIAQASVISAQNANAAVFAAPKWFHPLWYAYCLGNKEQQMAGAGFTRLTIFRPGMLQRHDPSRTLERVAASILPSLDVALLAKAMVDDAESEAVNTQMRQEPVLIHAGNAAITKLANL